MVYTTHQNHKNCDEWGMVIIPTLVVGRISSNIGPANLQKTPPGGYNGGVPLDSVDRYDPRFDAAHETVVVQKWGIPSGGVA